MRLTIDFDPQEEAWLNDQARQQGLQPAEIIKCLVDERLRPLASSVPDAENQALINLLSSWREEDATDDPDEIGRRAEQTKAFMKSLEANRLRLRNPKL